MTDFTDYAERVRRQLESVPHPPEEPTVTAFGRAWAADEFFQLTADFTAMGRMWPMYNGQSPEVWLQEFGAAKKKAEEDLLDSHHERICRDE